MRYAILSDIHSNLEALRAVLDRIAGMKIDEICCLGDVVGYNADPNECVDIARSEGMRCLMGNHDSRAAGLEEPEDFNPSAARAVLWTRERLTPENRQFLRDLPRVVRADALALFHGSLQDTDRYILTLSDVRDQFRALRELPSPARFGLFGHTHVPIAFTLANGAILIGQNENIRFSDDRSYLINPGSVGQPRDGDPRAAFAVYDQDARELSFHRVEYDIRACQDKVLRAGLPPRLAERLAIGR